MIFKLYKAGLIICLLSLTRIGMAQEYVQIGHSNKFGTEVRIWGTIRDYETTEILIGSSVYIEELKEGTSTDLDGIFELDIPCGEYTMITSYLGYQNDTTHIRVNGKGDISISLEKQTTALQEVVVSSIDPRTNLSNVKMGVTRLSSRTIEALPLFAGEMDALKSLILLPGVSTVGEASAGFNIRGGSADQNLILFGGVPIYNPSHLFGYFSTFNSEMIDGLTVYKGGIPARYGGRSSSIIDIELKEGNLQKWKSNISLGTISAQASAEGPVIQDRLSVLVSVRGSYSGWILKQVKDPEIRNSSANFFDVNTNLTYRINNSNRLNYSYYRSGDKFNLLSNNEFNWENELQSLKWNGNLTKKLFSSITLSQSKYDYGAVEKNFLETFDYQSSLVDQNANLDLNYLLKDNNTISLGIGLKKIQISPGKLLNINQDEQILPVELEKEQGQEIAMYIQDELALGEKIGLSYGVRMNIFRYLGPKTVFNYTPFQPRTETYIESQTTFGKNDLIKSYHGFEPRFSLRYTLDEHSSLKAGYNRLIQNIALISNTVSIAPTDVWKLADTHLQPSTSDQYSLGYFRNFLDNTYEFSIEAYFKQINNLIDYKDGANLLLNQTIETELLSGEGLAYGIEVLLKKQIGTLSGWMSYTYSRSLRRVIGIFEDETINDGDWFPSFFDKPHDLTAVLQYRVSPRFKISSVFTYSTGRPISYPVAKFFYQNQDVAFYESRNGFRVPDYQRLDFSMTWSFKTEKKILAGDWILSIYNLTARRNAFSVFFDQEPFSPPQAYKLATLGIAFPSLNYKISL